MPYKQRDVVKLKFPFKLPDGSELDHPVLIISSNMSISYEHYYTGVMMSSTQRTDRFSFPCRNEMFQAPIKDCSQIRSYLSVSFRDQDIIKKVNEMGLIHFKALHKQIMDYLFCIDG